MTAYIVSWSVELDDESTASHEDAAEQAWDILGDAISQSGPATVLVVRRTDDTEAVPFDMAYDPPIVLDRYGMTEARCPLCVHEAGNQLDALTYDDPEDD